MKLPVAVPLALVVLPLATAHTIFTQLKSGTTQYGISYGVRTPSYDGPITDVTSNDVACNGGPNPTMSSPYVIDVAAGSTVQATWRHTLTSGPEDVIDASHKGPVIAYLKKVNNAATDVGYGSGWFKISEAGYNPSTKTWAVDDLIAAKGIQNIPIPACIPSGQYLLRAELIALHGAGSPSGAQLYMECAQINVVGGTGTASPSTVSFPGAYSASDPGILISIYGTLSSYTIPGPAVFTCAAGGGGSGGGATTSAKPPTTTLVTSTKTTTSAATTSTAAAGGAPLYGQCGGTGWSGATTCASGTCKKSSDYYSQCLP
ncbi:endoglucanase ii [Phlyctema vagabunda]|uniref:AA9 family lytic polysaccharide monooxygenase n=1 Tax=Phlyctema vagabunda TaxID=108571 RepID=A0ABR4PMX2_9HELO